MNLLLLLALAVPLSCLAFLSWLALLGVMTLGAVINVIGMARPGGPRWPSNQQKAPSDKPTYSRDAMAASVMNLRPVIRLSAKSSRSIVRSSRHTPAKNHNHALSYGSSFRSSRVSRNLIGNCAVGCCGSKVVRCRRCRDGDL